MTKFLFGPYTLTFQPIDEIFFYVSALFFTIGIVLFLILFFVKFEEVNKKLLGKIKILSLGLGILGLIFSGLRFENATYFSWRFWFVIIFAIYAFFFLKVLWYLAVRYRSDLKISKARQIKEKYLK